MPNSIEARRGGQVDWEKQRVTFAVFSRNAERLEAWIYDQPRQASEIQRVELSRSPDGIWSGAFSINNLRAASNGILYYGYRAWGPNWHFDRDWVAGSGRGFVSDVDDRGNRFNPNKLLLDPYAREISHDPDVRKSTIDPNEVIDEYYSGPENRLVDTGPMAPKVVLAPGSPPEISAFVHSQRLLKDDVICELHTRGFTMLDPSIPEQFRGTYKGAGLKAIYLRELGVTAVQLLPVFQFANEQNDDGDPRGDNYWGYMSLSFFAANRRYAADKSPGAPAREFREMVQSFHREGIKVFLDVAFSHTAEGILRRTTDEGDSRSDDAKQLTDRAALLCLRGLDNATYYTLRSNPLLDGGKSNQRYQDDSACGPNLNVTGPAVRELICDSLRYWYEEMGVDGFRFDLAPLLANSRSQDGFVFDWSNPRSLLRTIGSDLPLRQEDNLSGADLIAEPWGASSGTYCLGRFPDGWAEWNDKFRETLRGAENKLDVATVLPWEVANAVSGSAQQFQPNRIAARPWNSINYVAAHDGLTLWDLFAFSHDGGWDHLGDAAKQRQAVRNMFALLATSAGVPMFMAGDEFHRTQGGCANAVAIDDPSMYVHWPDLIAPPADFGVHEGAAFSREPAIKLYEFVKGMWSFRRSYTSLRPLRYFSGAISFGSQLKDIAWHFPDASELSGDGWSDPQLRFLGYRVDTEDDFPNTGTRSIYIAYNWDSRNREIVLPRKLPALAWRRVIDTSSWLEPMSNFDPQRTVIENEYIMHERSVAIFVES